MQGNKIINEINNLADQQYWDDAYVTYDFSMVHKEDIIRKWIEQYIPKTTTGKCFEIGCFPGRYLSVLGNLGYELNGIDLTPRVTTDFPNWLKRSNFKTGTFEQIDIFKFSTEKRFDVVCSFGFIEHFKNWEDVIKVQASLVRVNGYLVIETPNFRGVIQRLIHLILDYKNYKRHNILSMNPTRWQKIIEEMGFEVDYSGYIGHFDFWIDEPPKSYFKRILLRLLLVIAPWIKRLKEDRLAYAPYCGIIARKIK